MLNVNRITTVLARMPDEDLQKYAEMHKADPYIMALAMSESNRRKEVRSADQGSQEEQPKVVDQMIAGMAPRPAQPMPEDMGIGAIPAPNMTMANGGIAGYDGYDEGDSDFGQGPVMMMSGGGVASELVRFLQSSGIDYVDFQKFEPAKKDLILNEFKKARAGAVAASAAAPAAAPAAPAAQAAQGSRFRGFNPKGLAGYGLGLYSGDLNQGEDAELERRRAIGPTIDGITAPPPIAASPVPSANTAPKADTPPTDGRVADPRAGTERRNTDRIDPSAGRRESTEFDLSKMFDTALLKEQSQPRPEKKQLEQLVADRKKSAEDELTGIRGLNEKFVDAFKGKRGRLDTREGAIEKMKDQNLGLALLQAGAAMMSTPGNLGTVVGRGIQSGSQQYVAGLDKINSAKDKLADARDRLDELQLNRDDMSAREILKAESNIRSTALAGQETMIKYVMERDNVNRETALKIVESQVKIGLEREGMRSREDVARISAAPGLERNALLRLANNKDDKVRAEYGKLQKGVMDTLNKDPNYTMANPTQQQVLQTTALRQALMNNPFLSSYASGIGFSAAPTGGKVYDLTED